MPSSNGYEQLRQDEGFTPKADYLHTQKGGKEKNRTLGHGYNIDAASDPQQDLVDSGVDPKDVDKVLSGELAITEEQASTLFDISVRRAAIDAERVISNFKDLDKPVQDVLINMSYQLGAKGLRKFKNMRLALLDGDYNKVAKEIMNSEMARNDSTNRATRLSKSILDYSKSLPPKPKPKSPKELLDKAIQDKHLSKLSKVYSKELMMTQLQEAYKKIPKESETTTEAK